MITEYEEYVKVVSPELRKKFYAAYNSYKKTVTGYTPNVRSYFFHNAKYWNERLRKEMVKEITKVFKDMKFIDWLNAAPTGLVKEFEESYNIFTSGMPNPPTKEQHYNGTLTRWVNALNIVKPSAFQVIGSRTGSFRSSGISVILMRTKPKCIKSGNIVLFRDGHCGMVVCCNSRYYIMHKKKDGLFVMRDVLDRYSASLHHIHDSSQDILSIVAPKSAIIKESQWKDAINGYADIEIVFENKEKTISMKEIAELLDCDVKDVIITK